MKAMVLAAGFGSRMGELTRYWPKPLLKVAEKSLIEHLLESLKKAAINDVVINVSHLGEKIINELGNGSKYGLNIRYSEEAEPLEWGGGVFQALPYLGKEPFLVVSGDLWTDFPFQQLPSRMDGLAHLVLINEPSCHKDFSLDAKQLVSTKQPQATYGGIGVFHPDLFKDKTHDKFSFCDVIVPAINAGRVSGEYYQGVWENVGTPECLAKLRQKQLSLVKNGFLYEKQDV